MLAPHHRPFRLAGLLTSAAMLLTMLIPSPTAVAEDHIADEAAAGLISGRITTPVDDGRGGPEHAVAEIYDAATAELIARHEADTQGEWGAYVEPGSYLVVFYNSSDGTSFTDFFPEMYRGHALFSGRFDTVTVEADAEVAVDGTLRPLFDDMFETPFTDDIFFMGNTGITRGCNPEAGNTLYCPQATVTRGQMAAFLVRAFDLTDVDETIDFEDVAASPFRRDILRLATAGITRGCNPDDGNTRFCPDEPVTRGQMAAFMVRAFGMGHIDDDVAFTDTRESIFEDDILRLASAAVTRGCNPPGNDRYCPAEPVTRGQMAAFLRRAFEWLGAETGEAAFDAPTGSKPGDRREALTER